MESKDQELRVDVGSVKNESRIPIYWLRQIDTKKKTTRWIISEQCPVVKSIVDSLNRIKVPSIVTPGSTKKNPVVYPMDTPRYTITVPAWFDDRTMAAMTIAGASSPHITDWIGKAGVKLEPCWRAEKPDFVAN